MIIAGLDPSLNQLGWFIFDTKGIKVIDYGYIPNGDLEEDEKIVRIYNMLSKVFDVYKVDAAGIEEEFYSKNVDTLKKLSHVHGSILLLLAQRKIPHTYYSVMTAKSQTLGGIKAKKEDGTKKSGNEMKQEIANKIFEVFGRHSFMKDFTSDVTDAASIAYTYYLLDGKPIKKAKDVAKEKAAAKKKAPKEKVTKENTETKPKRTKRKQTE